MSSDLSSTELRELLYGNAYKGDWDSVINEYEKNPKARKLKLTRQGDTALHLAVIDNRVEVVKKLVGFISGATNKLELLKTTNERGNNPLHLAAVMGSVRMCSALASKLEELVDMRNGVGETPLYLAAAYGNTDAFFCLYNFCRDDALRIAVNCRVRHDGDTVLHYAIRTSSLMTDLAFQFINMNPEAVCWVNGAGLTPLHVLASKPTSFKSGSHIKGWQNIVYYCTFVKQLQPRSNESLSQELQQSTGKAEATPSYFPVNYQTCIDFFTGIKDIFWMVWSCERLKKNTKNDEANKQNDLEEQRSDTHEYHQRCLDTAAEPPTTNFPGNYTTCIDLFQSLLSAIIIILGFGSPEIKRIRKKKEKHTWSVQVMEKLLEFSVNCVVRENIPMDPRIENNEADEVTLPYNIVDDVVQFSNDITSKLKELEKPKDVIETETAMLLAAKNGVIEIVKGMHERFPLAIHDTTKDKKNVVLLAAEYRQTDVYSFLLKKRKGIRNLFGAVDHNGNSALHLAATAIDPKFWRITGAALQMQWEVKWYEYVKESVPVDFFAHYNNDGKTASAIFQETHVNLAAKGGEWLYTTSESCSLVATLIATVAFATAATIPGGNDDHGGAKLVKEQGFMIFSNSSLIALCLSSTSVIMFLAIMTSRFNMKDFGLALPWKLLIGLFCLYLSIIAMLISFCSGHYFLISNRLHNVAILLYTLTFLPVTLIFGIVQLPLYFDLLQALLKRVPIKTPDIDLSDRMGTTKTDTKFDDA